MKLYELTGKYREVSDMDDLDEITLKDTLDSLQEDIETKLQNIGFVIKEKKADLKAIEEAIHSLKEKKAAVEKSIERLQDYSQTTMEVIGIEKIKTPLLTVWIQDNKQSVHVLDEKKIDLNYFIEQPSKLDKNMLLADLKEGKKVEGAEIQQTRSLRIR